MSRRRRRTQGPIRRSKSELDTNRLDGHLLESVSGGTAIRQADDGRPEPPTPSPGTMLVTGDYSLS